MLHTRRAWLLLAGAALLPPTVAAAARPAPLVITGLKVTPVALPAPPLLAASGCHGPYFLRNVLQLQTDSGVVGLGEVLHRGPDPEHGNGRRLRRPPLHPG